VLLAGVGVGVSSSLIPYVTDQLAMARLPRATYATMVALLPAFATIIGIVVLTQVPSWPEVTGIALVIAGVALHRPHDAARPRAMPEEASSTSVTHQPGARYEPTMGIGAAQPFVRCAEEHLHDLRARATTSRRARGRRP
jgi:inner membrane transporter RhtA